MEKEEMIKMRDTFKELSELINEIIILDEREEKGEEINENEYKSKLGLFTYKMIVLTKTLEE